MNLWRTSSAGRWAMVMLALASFSFPADLSLAAGADASAWTAGYNARVRLVTGLREASGDWLIGVEIETEPSWHTYWRNPGDSGVPPVFDWNRSSNLAAADVLWPAPFAIDSGYGISIGYEGGVVFPVRLRPTSAGQPIEVALQLDYAVCDDICVPLSAELALTLGPRSSSASTENLVKSALSRVPRAQGNAAVEPRIIAAQTEQRDAKIVLLVDARADAVASLFIDGPPEYYFAVPPAPESMGGGMVQFTVEVDGAKAAGDLAGKRIGATLVVGDDAVEYWWSAE